MHRSQSAFPLRFAFTLVELLAVIAVIGVLAAILIPLTGKIRQQAESSTCVSNLRQIGMGFHLYAGENDGYMPKPADYSKGPDWTGFWMYQIEPYLDNRTGTTEKERREICFSGVFTCPSNEDWDLESTNYLDWGSYGMNTFEPAKGSPLKAVSLLDPNEVPEPSRIALVVEARDAQTFSHFMISQQIPQPMHGDSDNILFCDMHVETLPRGSLYWAGTGLYAAHQNGLVRKPGN